MSLSSHDRTQFSFSSLPGQGVIFSVIVRDPVLNTSASYIPVHTYACSFNSTLDGCNDLGEKIKENEHSCCIILFITSEIPFICEVSCHLQSYLKTPFSLKKKKKKLLNGFCDRFDIVSKCKHMLSLSFSQGEFLLKCFSLCSVWLGCLCVLWATASSNVVSDVFLAFFRNAPHCCY